MSFKRISIIALCACSLIFGAALHVSAAEMRDEIIDTLKGLEAPSGSLDDLDDKALSEVALLTKTLEAKRDNYARAIELYVERIGAGKDVDSARIEYERAEISLGAELKNTRKVLDILKKQERVVHAWRVHHSLHPEHQHAMEHRVGHPSEESQSLEHSETNPVGQQQEHHSNEPATQPARTQANAAPIEPLY